MEAGKIKDKEKSRILEDSEQFFPQISRSENDQRITGLGYQGKDRKNLHSKLKNKKTKGTRAFATTETVKTAGKKQSEAATFQQ